MGKIAAGEAGGLKQHHIQEHCFYILEYVFVRALDCPEQLHLGAPLTQPTAHQSIQAQVYLSPALSPGWTLDLHLSSVWPCRTHPLTLPGAASECCVTTTRLCPLSLDPVELCSDLGGHGLCWGHSGGIHFASFME